MLPAFPEKNVFFTVLWPQMAYVTHGFRLGEGLKSAVVLMVDDEPSTLEVLAIFLHAEGYRDVVKVTDPRKALEMIASLEPDVVLLNLGMPHVSGDDIHRFSTFAQYAIGNDSERTSL